MRRRDSQCYGPHLYIFNSTQRNGATEMASMRSKAICRNPDILGGTPVFSGTRVPIRILFEHLEAGDCLDDFLDAYQTVSRDRAIEVLRTAKTVLIGKSGEALA